MNRYPYEYEYSTVLGTVVSGIRLHNHEYQYGGGSGRRSPAGNGGVSWGGEAPLGTETGGSQLELHLTR